LIPGQLTAEGQVLFDGEVLVLARRPKLRVCATSMSSTPNSGSWPWCVGRSVAVVRWSIRGHRGEPSSRQVDEQLDERNQLIGS